MKQKSICVITNGYPTKEDPVYAFIQPLVREMADNGIHCTVIAPQSISNRVITKKKKRPYKWIDKTEKGNEIVIYQPQYISVSKVKLLDQNISIVLRDKAIINCFLNEKIETDILYAHFWDCGIAACKIAERINVPLYVASGESKIRVFDYYPERVIEKYKKYVSGVVFVSTKNLNESKTLNLLENNSRVIVLPNAYDPHEFYSIPQKEARESLGIPGNKKVAIFVGAFSERKGVLRVVEAAKQIDDLQLILIGSGELQPNGAHILYSGKLPHEQVVTYLNAADIFVLPTLAEGCCNAIVEALACGLPVISSDLPFNYDILDETNSILINPKSVLEIAEAMKYVFSDSKIISNLSEGAKLKANSLSIESRCKKLCDFIGIL